MKSIIKSGFAHRTTIYGVLASITCLVCAVICSSLIVGAIGVLSLAVHAVSKH